MALLAEPWNVDISSQEMSHGSSAQSWGLELPHFVRHLRERERPQTQASQEQPSFPSLLAAVVSVGRKVQLSTKGQA